MRAFSRTDTGRRREMNQDYMYTSEMPVGNLPNLYVLADGMGGHNAGDYASRFLVQHLRRAAGRFRLLQFCGLLYGRRIRRWWKSP